MKEKRKEGAEEMAGGLREERGNREVCVCVCEGEKDEKGESRR